MFQAIRPATRAVAAAALLSGFAAALPALAQSSAATGSAPPVAAPTSPAPAPTAPSVSSNATAATAPAPAAKAERHSARVEEHIADLKKKLKITDAQNATWETFAAVMRENGEAMEAAIQEREDTKDLDAIHDLQSYAKIAQTHADGAAKLATAFQPVYDSLSPAQKKNADTLFEHTRRGGAEHARKK